MLDARKRVRSVRRIIIGSLCINCSDFQFKLYFGCPYLFIFITNIIFFVQKVLDGFGQRK